MINCNFCKNEKFKLKFLYTNKPKKETYFGIKDKDYKRCYIKCSNCKHLYSILSFDLNNLYKKIYSEKTYGKKIYQTFQKIINLPKKKSDNFYRVRRILKFFNSKNIFVKNLIDIGSGTGVFPYSMLKNNYNITCVEPDKNLSKHLKKNLNLKVITQDIFKHIFKKKYDVITLNKVLEHVNDPFKFMKKLNSILKDKGIIYLEVPDVYKAAKYGLDREEFYVEHIHGFSKKSLLHLFNKTKFKIIEIKSIKESSEKFTIYCFLAKLK